MNKKYCNSYLNMNYKMTMNYCEFMTKYPNFSTLDPVDMPEDLTISTMTLVCKMPIKFDVITIARELELSSDFIQTVTCGNNREIHRTLNPVKCKRRRNKKRRNFYNQVTIIISCSDVVNVNIKIFRNGSIQMTGCKKISPVIWGLYKLFSIMKEHKNKFAEPFVSLNIFDIKKFKIAMINSNFNIGFKINRDKLFYSLIDDKYDCEYDPSRHAGVKIRHSTEQNEKPPSIFVFGKGSIIITGAHNYRQIIECYIFVNKYLIENYNKIIFNFPF